MAIRQHLLSPNSWSVLAALTEMCQLDGALYYYEKNPPCSDEYSSLLLQQLAILERFGKQAPIISSDFNLSTLNMELAFAYSRCDDRKNAERYLSKLVKLLDTVTQKESGKNEHSSAWMPSGIQRLWELTRELKGEAATRALQKRWYPDIDF